MSFSSPVHLTPDNSVNPTALQLLAQTQVAIIDFTGQDNSGLLCLRPIDKLRGIMTSVNPAFCGRGRRE
jgi:hypothetical protein